MQNSTKNEKSEIHYSFAKTCWRFLAEILRYERCKSMSKTHKCKSCRSRQELSNEYLLAKIGVDTAENEPLKVCLILPYLPRPEIWFSHRYHAPSRLRPTTRGRRSTMPILSRWLRTRCLFAEPLRLFYCWLRILLAIAWVKHACQWDPMRILK